MIPFELVDIGKFFDAELAWENLPFILEGLPMTIAVPCDWAKFQILSPSMACTVLYFLYARNADIGVFVHPVSRITSCTN